MKIKKKLRDVTNKEYSKWKMINCNSRAFCYQCPFFNVSCCENAVDSWANHRDLYSDKFLDQEIEVEAPDILDKEEREYLSAVIKPFREKVISITKYYSSLVGNNQYICISIRQGQLGKNAIMLPYFKCNTMYKGMELDKSYTIQELGL